jgi:hypothetical protein
MGQYMYGKVSIMALKTPVLLIIFNRPDTAQRVFDAIRQAQPEQLFVAADGPREGKEGEAEKCRLAREIVKQVDWDCQVRTLFRENNLGVGLGPATAIDWFFENVEEGIILEDDCVPHSTFFRFCEELLIKYRDDQRVMLISGLNFLGKWKPENQSYHFSYGGHTWGWASWRRAWDYFDYDLKLWGKPEVKTAIKHTLCDIQKFNFLSEHFDEIYSDKKHIHWDGAWAFSRLLYSGLSVIPSVNLISYIGFGERATWNLNLASPFVKWVATLPVYSVSFPLQHPFGVTGDRDYDRIAFLKSFKTPEGSKLTKILIKLLRISRIYGLAVIVVRPLYWKIKISGWDRR